MSKEPLTEIVSENDAHAYITLMFAAVKDHDFATIKACMHEHEYHPAAPQLGSVTFFIDHKENDKECGGCFAERMDDAYHVALQRIWSLLAPIACENLDKLRSSSAKEVSVAEMLARAHMAWELAEEMLFAGGFEDVDHVMIADEKEASRRAKRLDAPMRKLLETTGKRLKSSQSFDGKVGIIERYRALREKIEAALTQQTEDIETMRGEADKDE